MLAALIDIKKHFLKIMIFSIIGIGLGYFMLEEVASWEKVLPGQVFYIVFGCIFIAVSAILS